MCYNYYYYEYFFNIKNMIQKKGFSIEFQTRNKYWSFFLFLTNDGSDGNWKRGIGLCGSINLEFVDLDSREFDYFGLSLPACYWWMLTCCGFIILVFLFSSWTEITDGLVEIEWGGLLVAWMCWFVVVGCCCCWIINYNNLF